MAIDVEEVSRGAPAMTAELRAARAMVSSVVAALAESPESLVGSEAGRLCVLLAEVERLAAAGKALAAARVGETGYHRTSHPTVEQWLAAVTKASPWEATKAIKTARLLSSAEGGGGDGSCDLAELRDAFVHGELTPTQADELASTCAKQPHKQSELLDLARSETTEQLKKRCLQERLAGRPDETPEQRAKRLARETRINKRDLGNGLSSLQAVMPTEWLLLLWKSIERQRRAIFDHARIAGVDYPTQVYGVLALVTLAVVGAIPSSRQAASAADDQHEADLAIEGSEASGLDADDAAEAPGGGGNDLNDTGDGDGDGWPVDDDPVFHDLLAAIAVHSPDDGGGAPGRRRRLRRGRCRCGGRVAARAEIHVRCDLSALLRGYAVDGELCDIPGWGPVPVELVRRHWGDALVRFMITDGIDVKNVTTLSRSITAAMEAAMRFEMPLCTTAGCDREAFLEFDHRLGYALTHRTNIDEMDRPCWECHDLRTNHNWQYVNGTGRRPLVPPGHPDHPGRPPTPRRQKAAA